MAHAEPVAFACVEAPAQPVADKLLTLNATPDEPAGATNPTYVLLSEKKASAAGTSFLRSDLMAMTYAFFFVSANFGIATAAKMPMMAMMATKIKSSMRVKPFRVRVTTLYDILADANPAPRPIRFAIHLPGCRIPDHLEDGATPKYRYEEGPSICSALRLLSPCGLTHYWNSSRRSHEAIRAHPFHYLQVAPPG